MDGKSRSKCPACRKSWVEHLGISGTCAELQEAKAKLAKVTAERDALKTVLKKGRELCSALFILRGGADSTEEEHFNMLTARDEFYEALKTIPETNPTPP